MVHFPRFQVPNGVNWIQILSGFCLWVIKWFSNYSVFKLTSDFKPGLKPDLTRVDLTLNINTLY